ncbi:hypothetical protein ARMSODRAFT_310630 [Armillaria solidipes]|uniref:F-box domain-containing protein n=1 Tax=Armillaria solidipes TaxID=1076256 RepID=A0A2H3BWP9_9AGAR|nr:hypothetical protein ARMSODRAFT_310630 [Armillaria solidipes]
MPSGRPRKKCKPSNAIIHDDSPTKRLSRRCAMMELPEDLFLEICSFLEPLDLLHLARVSKPFRVLLMSRSSRGAWKSARTNVPGLPHPFPGTSEPAWACLAFVNECTFCSNTAYVPAFLLRARICSACLDSNWKERTAPSAASLAPWPTSDIRPPSVNENEFPGQQSDGSLLSEG